MKEENEINEALGQLLDALEEQGRNARRQKQLGDLIDALAAQEKTAEMPRRHRNLVPLWWAMGVAAACLLLWIVLKPTGNQIDNMEKPVVAEQIHPVDSTTEEVQETAPLQEPKMAQEPVAALEPIEVRKPIDNKVEPKKEVQPEALEMPLLAEVKETETVDSDDIAKDNPVAETPSEPLAAQAPTVTRRVIKSTNLVGYGKLENISAEPKPKRSILENKTLFGQPQDPNMQGGMLAYEIKF